MKDCKRSRFGNPQEYADAAEANKTIDFLLEELFRDETHSYNDKVAGSADYDELIGALLRLRKTIENLEAGSSGGEGFFSRGPSKT